MQDLIDCGRYATRTIKAKGPDRRKTEIQEVSISEEMEANENATLWKDWFWCEIKGRDRDRLHCVIGLLC